MGNRPDYQRKMGSQVITKCSPSNGKPGDDSSKDWELLENMTLAAKSPPKYTKSTITRVSRTVKFVLWDKRKMEQLIKQPNYWNNSLDRMRSRLDQESSRPRLRTYLSTGDTTQLQYLEAAAALFQHRDLEKMASARSVIEQSYRSEPLHSPETMTSKPTSEYRIFQDIDPEQMASARSVIEKGNSSERPHQPDTTTPNSTLEFRLEMGLLRFQSLPYQTDQVRAMAKFGQESIIVDWRGCQDDTWRWENPAAFRRRTGYLTKILNTDLRPIDISDLHFVGCLDQNINVTGYTFRIPQDAQANQTPVTLHQVLMRATKLSDISDLGDRVPFGQGPRLNSFRTSQHWLDP